MQPHQTVVSISTRTVIKVIALVLLAWLLVSIGKMVASALLLLAIGVFLAVALDPVVRFIQRSGLPRLWAVVTLMALLLCALGGLTALFAAPLASQSSNLAKEAPHFKEHLLRHKMIDDLNERTKAVDKAAAAIEKLPEAAADDATEVVSVIAHGVIGTLTLIFLTAFLLIEGPHLAAGATVLWPQLRERRWWTLLQQTYGTIGDYVGGTLLVALIDGVVIAILALVLGIPFALPLAVWATIWGVLPIVGSVIGTVPAIIVALTVSPVAALIVLIVSILYHSVARAILHPAIVGRAIEMSAFFVFLAILLGESMLGLVGILLAVPCAGIIQLVIADMVQQRQAGEIVTAPESAPIDAPKTPPDDAAPVG
jgi:predicted PurR-regulated permease PerM